MAARPLDACLGCCTGHLESVIDLGYHPVANNLLTAPDQAVPAYPLALNRCRWCGLMQLSHLVDRQEVFSSAYPYRSGMSKGWQLHCQKLARSFTPPTSLGAPTLLDIGGNDGTAALAFQEQGYSATVLDPCAEGSNTIRAFFSESVAHELDTIYSVILAQNVLAHVADPAGFLRGVSYLLDPVGSAIIECPGAPPATDICQIYHEHVTYWSLRAMEVCAAQAGLVVTHVQPIDVHGGSVRYILKHAPDTSWDAWGAVRKARTQDRPEFSGADTIGQLMAARKALLNTTWAIGASAKLATLLSLIGPNSVTFVLDDCPEKQGKYLPTGQPIVPPQDLSRVDTLLIGAWNWAEGLKQRAKELGFKGRFVVPFA